MHRFSKQMAVLLAVSLPVKNRSSGLTGRFPAGFAQDVAEEQKRNCSFQYGQGICGRANNPRGLKFGPDGNLYVAEAGKGGTASTIGVCDQVPFPVGPYHGSPASGRISKIDAAGMRTTVTDQLPSSMANEIIGGDVEGVANVAFIKDQLYAVLAGAGCSHGVPQCPTAW